MDNLIKSNVDEIVLNSGNKSICFQEEGVFIEIDGRTEEVIKIDTIKEGKEENTIILNGVSFSYPVCAFDYVLNLLKLRNIN